MYEHKVDLDTWKPGEDVDDDARVLDVLRFIEDVARTPEWSASTIEDVVEVFRDRIVVGPDYDEDDDRYVWGH